MILLASAGVTIGDLAGESTTLLVVVVMAIGGWRLLQYLRSDQRLTDTDYARRLDRQRGNVHTMVAYAAALTRLVPHDVDVPDFPTLAPEVDKPT